MRRIFGVVALALTLAPSAWADAPPDKQRARDAYERGTAAYKRGDFAGAAAAYAEADAIAPSDTALQAALDAAVKADDPARGAELLERARTRPIAGALATSVKNADAKLAHRAGKVRLHCNDVPCSGTVDGAELPADVARWIGVGAHAVTITALGRVTTQSIAVQPDATVDVTPPKDAPPAPLPAPTVAPTPTDVVPTPAPVPATVPAEKPKGVGPAVSIVLLGSGALAGAASAFALLSAKGKHDDFVAHGCPTVGSSDCTSRASDGQTMMITGEVLMGLSVAALVSGAVVAIGYTRWKSAPAVQAGPQGAWFGWRGEF